jgi:hypothetical protein
LELIRLGMNNLKGDCCVFYRESRANICWSFFSEMSFLPV